MDESRKTEKQKFFERNVKQIKFKLRPNMRKLKPMHPDLIGACNEIDEDKSNYIIAAWLKNENGTRILEVAMYREKDQQRAQEAFKNGIDPSTDIVQGNSSFKLENEDDLPM